LEIKNTRFGNVLSLLITIENRIELWIFYDVYVNIDAGVEFILAYLVLEIHA